MDGQLFQLGNCESTAASRDLLNQESLQPESLFRRHGSGDWGEAPDWLRRDNDRAAHAERDSHAIRSQYTVCGKKVLVITAVDRSSTLLQLESEFAVIEVGVRDGYALWASSYERPNPLITVEEPIIDSTLASLPPFRTAIDVGTGTGRVARKLARLAAHHHRSIDASHQAGLASDEASSAPRILGVDATPEMLDIAMNVTAAEGLSHLSFRLAELGTEALPSPASSFDVLTSCLMLCHVPGLRAAIEECVRVVRTGGHLVITDFHPATALFGWRSDFVTPSARLLMPNESNTRQDYLDALTDAGCHILEIHDIALDGTPYGDLSEAAMRARGWPPLCLVIHAVKN